MLNKYLLFIALLFTAAFAGAQELKCDVKITTPKLQTADPKVFTTLESSIRDFMNNQKWTDIDFKEGERIECSIAINIQDEYGENRFKADIAISSNRPIFGSDYKTAQIIHVDAETVFTYEEFQPIIDSRDVFQDNLSSLLSFYAYLFLGYDFDSFSAYGGEEYFRTAQNILNAIPPRIADEDKGWVAGGNKLSRYWLIENLVNPRTTIMRQAWYDYHRLGLDVMHKDPTLGQTVIFAAIQKVAEVNNNYPNSMIVRMFSNAKSDEILEIFKQADRMQRTEVYQLMRRIDPSNASKYNVLRS